MQRRIQRITNHPLAVIVTTAGALLGGIAAMFFTWDVLRRMIGD